MINSLENLFIKHKCVYCYGTGTWGKIIGEYCKKNGYRLSGYIVSEMNKKRNSLVGVKIFEVKQIKIQEDDVVIIATEKQEYLEEMRIALLKYTKCKKIYIPLEQKDFVKEFQKIRWKRRRVWSLCKKKKSIFDYLELSRNFNFWGLKLDCKLRHVESANMAYGQDVCIKKYLRGTYCNLQDSTILHYASFENCFTEREVLPLSRNFFCMGKRCYPQKEYPQVNVYEIGPYVRHVKPVISVNKLKKLKQKLGKTLLVVPTHTHSGANGLAYEINDFVKKIEEIKKKYNYKTVLIMLYFSSIQKGLHKYYLGHDYRIVTAGDVFDINFLGRLRTFVDLADVTMGNDLHSTFIGYSISLNKPHFCYSMDIDYDDISYETMRTAGYKYYENGKSVDIDVFTDKIAMSREKQFKGVFSKYRENVTKEQIEIVERYWGKWNKRRMDRDMML